MPSYGWPALAGQRRLGLLQLSWITSLNGYVRWLGLRRDMPAVLDAADGFVSSSAWEGMPLAVGEAMAMEKHVVATDVGGVRELVGGAGVSFLAKLESTRVRYAQCDATKQRNRLALGRAARERIVREFGMDANADRWEALYWNLLEKCLIRAIDAQRKAPECCAPARCFCPTASRT